jgi:peptidoglycan/xylan/chitin deacetylase (PgdA/CDA1 family)
VAERSSVGGNAIRLYGSSLMRLGQSDVLALSYHAVSATWPDRWSVTPTQLEDQLQSILNRGYVPVSVSQVGDPHGPTRALVVTFDDGFASVHSRAAPILRRLDVIATIFPCTHHTSSREVLDFGFGQWKGTAYEAELTPMTWEQLAELRDRGWEIGSHGVTHANLTELSSEALHAELRDSRRTLQQRLGIPCSAVAYPYGFFDDRVVDAAREAGYTVGMTLLRHRQRRSDPMRMPRVVLSHDVGRARARLVTSPVVRTCEPVAWHLRRLVSRPS